MKAGYRGALALGALIVGAAMTGPASAQSAPPAATAAEAAANGAGAAETPQRKTTTTRIAVLVVNRRAVELTELDATPAGGASAMQIVANLAGGDKTTVRIARGKSCLFDLHGAFEDGSSTHVAGIDLCKDGRVNLVN
jgi:hypothetical protein